MYTETDYPTKKAFKDAFKSGTTIIVYQPGGLFPGISTGTTTIEGPHFPKPHKWYARVEVENYIVKKILG